MKFGGTREPEAGSIDFIPKDRRRQSQPRLDVRAHTDVLSKRKQVVYVHKAWVN